jgi:quinol monooxygenase YgiN
MSDVTSLIEFSIKDGKLAEFKEKAAGYADAVRSGELGTIEYRWWLSEDGGRCLVKEAFDSSESFLKHLENVGPSLPDLIEIAPITRLEVFGDVSAEAPAPLEPLGAQHFGHLVGFAR